jgi:NADPH2 dehydrogenase
MKSLNRCSPLQINSQYILKNRIVIPPMGSGTASEEGFVTLETLKHYSLLTEAQAGLLIVEYTYVHPTGRNEQNQLGISKEKHIQGLSTLSQLICESGALAGIQLSHSGAKSNLVMTENSLMGPSGITIPSRDRKFEKPASMSVEDIKTWKQAFIEAARRAVTAGFRLIEFHAAHGYGLNQFLSPLTNRREDIYGQSFEGRTRLLREIIQAVRDNYPDLLISVRMPGQDFFDGGLTISDAIELAKALEKLGINILNVSSGLGGGKRPSTREGEGYLAEEAEKIQAVVSIPVIAVGGITSGEYIDQGLQAGRFSLAAVGRALRKNPKDWYEKNLSSSLPK